MERIERMGSDDPREALWFLAGAVAIGLGAAYLYGTQDGRRVRRQILWWAEEAQRRLAEIQDVLEMTRQLCEGELPGDLLDAPGQRMRVVKGG